MKVYVISKGRYADGNFGWKRRREEAMDFASYYGNNGAIDLAIDHAALIRREPRCRGNQDARVVKYFED